MKDYLSCPLLYYYRHVLGIELPESPIHLHFGKSLHRALELYEKDKIDPIATFKTEFIADKLKDSDSAKFLELRLKGQEMIVYYLKNKPNYSIIKTEEKIKMFNVIDPKSKIALKFEELTGIIDFEAEGDILGDYKTSSHPYTQEEVDQSNQPTMYYLLYFLKYKKLPKKFVYIVFLKKRKKDMIQVLETSRNFSDMTKLITLLNEIHAKVENKEFNRGHDENAFCDCFKFDELLRV